MAAGLGARAPWGWLQDLRPGPFLPQAKYKAREAALKAQSERKPGGEREDRAKLPESPKRAEEIWQQSVIGDYMARFKVAGCGEGAVPSLPTGAASSPRVPVSQLMFPRCPQNDRVKALKAMEMTWNNMEKKEKLMWIKKAAEDQKRYEVGRGSRGAGCGWGTALRSRLGRTPLGVGCPPW